MSYYTTLNSNLKRGILRFAKKLFYVFARGKQGIDDMLRKRPKSRQLCFFNGFGFDWG